MNLWLRIMTLGKTNDPTKVSNAPPRSRSLTDISREWRPFESSGRGSTHRKGSTSSGHVSSDGSTSPADSSSCSAGSGHSGRSATWRPSRCYHYRELRRLRKQVQGLKKFILDSSRVRVPPNQGRPSPTIPSPPVNSFREYKQRVVPTKESTASLASSDKRGNIGSRSTSSWWLYRPIRSAAIASVCAVLTFANVSLQHKFRTPAASYLGGRATTVLVVFTLFSSFFGSVSIDRYLEDSSSSIEDTLD